MTFAAKPNSYAQKLNKKMYRGALRSIVSELARQGRLMVVEGFSVDTPKTKDLAARLRNLGVDDVLIVAEELDDNLMLACRNLHWVGLRAGADVDPLALVTFEKVLITVPALRQLEARLT